MSKANVFAVILILCFNIFYSYHW